MMIYPPIAELVKRAGSRYALVIETAKRARQLSKPGTPAFAKSDSSKEVAIAACEIYEGKLTAVLTSQIRQHRQDENAQSSDSEPEQDEEETSEEEE